MHAGEPSISYAMICQRIAPILRATGLLEPSQMVVGIRNSAFPGEIQMSYLAVCQSLSLDTFDCGLAIEL